MGVEKGINITSFPKQGSHRGKHVEVCFNYDTSKTVRGVVVRDDAEHPGLFIIKLDKHPATGEVEYVRSTECQYHILDTPSEQERSAG